MLGGRRFLALLAFGALLLGACGDDDGSDPDRATVPTAESTTTSTTAAATTTTAPPADFEALPIDPALTPEEQVEAAYLHSWDVYLDALESGRTDSLALAHRGAALDLRVEIVDGLVAEGQAVHGAVEHDYVVELVLDDMAVVTDRYTNHLVLVDSATGDPLEPDPNEVVEYRFTLVVEDGRWLVGFVE